MEQKSSKYTGIISQINGTEKHRQSKYCVKIIYRVPNVMRGQKRHGYSGMKKERPEKEKVGSVFNND